MDFFGIGPAELILILIVLLIVVPPSKLPEVAGTIGKGVRKFKEMAAELTKDFKGMAEEVKDAGKEEGGAARPVDGFATILKDVKKEVGDVRREVNMALKPGGEVAKELKGLVGDATRVKREVSNVVEGGMLSANTPPDIKDEAQGQKTDLVSSNNTEKKEDA